MLGHCFKIKMRIFNNKGYFVQHVNYIKILVQNIVHIVINVVKNMIIIVLFLANVLGKEIYLFFMPF